MSLPKVTMLNSHSLFIISLLLTLALQLPGCGGGTAGTGVRSYEGVIVAQDDGAVSNARVTIEQTGTSSLSDESGFFSLEEENIQQGDIITFLIDFSNFRVSFNHTVPADGVIVRFVIRVDVVTGNLLSVVETQEAIPAPSSSTTGESSSDGNGSQSSSSAGASSSSSGGNGSSTSSLSGSSSSPGTGSSTSAGSSADGSSSDSSTSTGESSSSVPAGGSSSSSTSNPGPGSSSSSQSSDSSGSSDTSSSSSSDGGSSSSSSSESSSSSSSTCRDWDPRNPADPPC